MGHSSSISVHNLGKHFTVPRRNAGLKAALRSVVRRATSEVVAVDGITFNIAPGEIVGVLAFVFHPTAHVTPLTVLLFFPSLLLAIAIRFLVEWSLGLSAFWTTQMSAVIQAYYVALFFLSGQMGPLTLFPVPVQVLAQLLPFQWMLAFPVQLLLGQVDQHAIVPGLVAQGIWLCLSLALMTVLWRCGLRRYTGTGA